MTALRIGAHVEPGRPARRGRRPRGRPRADLPGRPAGLEGARRRVRGRCRRAARRRGRRRRRRSTSTRRTWSTWPPRTTGSGSRPARSSSSTPTRPRRSAPPRSIVHGGHVTADDDPAVGVRQLAQDVRAARARRCRSSSRTPPAATTRWPGAWTRSPGCGTRSAASTSASASTPATPGPAAIELLDAGRPGQGDHRPDRPGARQRQQGRLRLRRATGTRTSATGTSTRAELVAVVAAAGAPVVCETPGGAHGQGADIAFLRAGCPADARRPRRGDRLGSGPAPLGWPACRCEVRPLAADAHLAFVTERSGSFLQTPAWAQVKAEWGSERLGWFDGDRLVGAGLVLLRQIPRVRRYLAYLPEGPVSTGRRTTPTRCSTPLLAAPATHGRVHGEDRAAAGHPPLVRRDRQGSAGRRARAPAARRPAAGRHRRRRPSRSADRLRALGLARRTRPPAPASATSSRGTSSSCPLAGRTAGGPAGRLQPAVAAQHPQGGEGRRRGHARAAPTTCRRSTGSTWRRPRATASPRGRWRYFQRMWPRDERRGPRPAAALPRRPRRRACWPRRPGYASGEHVWYSYGASSTAGREHRGSNAVQWRMMTRRPRRRRVGLRPARHLRHTRRPTTTCSGSIQFKLGTGGQAVEYLGEWDYPLSPVLHKAFELYLARR